MTKQECLEAEYRLTGKMSVGMRVRWKDDDSGLYIGTLIGPRTDGLEGLVIKAPGWVLKREPRFKVPPHPGCWFVDSFEYLEPYDWRGKKK